VTQPLPTLSTTSKYSLSPLLRLAILGTLFIVEKLFLDRFVDWDRAQDAQGFAVAVRTAQHVGFRFLVAFGAAMTLFVWVRGGEQLASVAASMRTARMRFGWGLVHILLLACLVPLTYELFAADAALPFPAVVVTWIALATGAALSAALAMADWSIWRMASRSLGVNWSYAAAAALLAASAIQLSQSLWEPTTAITFDLVRRILSAMIPSLTVDTANRILSTDRFAVQVSELCSGLEGMGLILAFTITWLVCFRREYIFPRALLLIPAGLVTMFLLNVLRIAALVLIGHIGYPEIAEFGFHSQAGWIAFNAAACGLVFFSRRSSWLNREATSSADSTTIENPTAVYVLPLLAVLAAGELSQAMSGTFEVFYPLRLVAGLSALFLYRRKLASLNWKCSALAPIVGILVFVIWILAAWIISRPTSMPDQLAAMTPAARTLWVAIRLVTSILVVPVVEELAYRGYLMRRLAREDFESMPYDRVRWPAVLIAAVAFGLAHGAFWIPGVVAGLAFGFILVRRNSIGEAVVAHVTANLLVAISVLAFDQWQLW
jgi:exosortase E/protease (VPEID-CTERM system)